MRKPRPRGSGTARNPGGGSALVGKYSQWKKGASSMRVSLKTLSLAVVIATVVAPAAGFAQRGPRHAALRHIGRHRGHHRVAETGHLHVHALAAGPARGLHRYDLEIRAGYRRDLRR